jgi:hypothetical protein
MRAGLARIGFAFAIASFVAVAARAETPTIEVPVPTGRLVGRVWERGTITPLPGVRVTTDAGETVTDEEGRFTLDLPEGEHAVAVTAAGFETYRGKEKIVAKQGLTVEYRLLPNGQRRRYESTVRGEGRHEGEKFTLRDEELHNLPGGLGDPFRVIGTLPGVSTPLPLLPYYVIRGASPGTNGFFLDGMRVPQLFHFLAGGGVVHGRLVDRIDFYPGTYDVSFGRYAGGIVDAETRPARSDGHHGEIELRLYDISGLFEFKLPNGVRLEVSGHYGYPSFIIQAVEPKVSLQYADYQLRLDWRGLTVEFLGSYDDLHLDPSLVGASASGTTSRYAPDDLMLQFHRMQIRYRHRYNRWEFEEALVGGIDEMATFGGTGVQKFSLGWRFLARAKWSRFRLYMGTDGELSRFNAANFADSTAPAAPDEWGDLNGNRDGVVAGAFLEGTYEIIKNRLQVTGGARIDTYHAGLVTLLGIDPRAQLKATLQPWLGIEAGVGLYQQPPSFPVALPGIDTFALQLGRQRSVQSSVGVETRLPQGFTGKITGYYSKFYNVNDIVVDIGPSICTAAPPEQLTGVPAIVTRQIDGQAYGMELLVRRSVGRVTGWISYTLSRSERTYSCGLRPSDYDQTHVLNVVVQARLPWKLMLGGRIYYATGRPITVFNTPDGSDTQRNNQRLPDFFELDVRLDREWIFKKWALSVFLEILNLTYSKSYFGISYQKIGNITYYNMPQYLGFNWILPSLGLRGRY